MLSSDNNTGSGNDVSSDVNLTIHQGKQNNHISGKNKYTNVNAYSDKPRSTIDEGGDPQKLLDQYSGTGELIDNGIPRVQPGSKERIRTDQYIGPYYDEIKERFVPTKNFTIHYSKNGVHIVPARP